MLVGQSKTPCFPMISLCTRHVSIAGLFVSGMLFALHVHPLTQSSYLVGALIRARKLARDCMAAVDVGPDERAVLDGRQKALKVMHSYP